MKEIKPSGWLIDDGGAWQFTTKSKDLAMAKRFNWKITPLYSKQDMVDTIAEAVGDYEASLSSFDWTAEEYIASRINNGEEL